MLYTVFCGIFIPAAMLVRTPEFATMRPDLLDKAVRLTLTLEGFYIITMIAFKISVAVFFMRVVVRPAHRYAVYVATGISVVSGLAYLFFAIFRCGVPTSGTVYLMRKLLKQCASSNTVLAMGYGHAAFVASTDWFYSVLAFLIISDLRMSWRHKLNVIFLLLLGVT